MLAGSRSMVKVRMFIRVSGSLPPRKIAPPPPAFGLRVGVRGNYPRGKFPRTVHKVEYSGFLDLELACYLIKKQVNFAK